MKDYTIADLKALLDFAHKEADHHKTLLNTDLSSKEQKDIYEESWEFWSKVYSRVEDEIYKRVENRFEYFKFKKQRQS